MRCMNNTIAADILHSWVYRNLLITKSSKCRSPTLELCNKHVCFFSQQLYKSTNLVSKACKNVPNDSLLFPKIKFTFLQLIVLYLHFPSFWFWFLLPTTNLKWIKSICICFFVKEHKKFMHVMLKFSTNTC